MTTEWIRGLPLGRGSFGKVNLAIPTNNNDPLMVVKSSDVSVSASLHNEKEVLRQLRNRCPQIVRWLGDDNSVENGCRLYNLFFEYASGGNLSNYVRRNRLSEFEVQRITYSILTGLSFIHDSGFVHCDIKLENILLFEDGEVKISDFGLASQNNGEKKNGGFELKGTPMYMAPEVVAGSGVDSPADIWALGCAVVEMVTRLPAWKCSTKIGVPALLCLIAAGNKSPEIPESLSEEGKDFVSKCFVQDPNERWTARMLLYHPFISCMGIHNNGPLAAAAAAGILTSPRGPFDNADYPPKSNESDADDFYEEDEPDLDSIMERIKILAGNPEQDPDWSDSEEWVTLR